MFESLPLNSGDSVTKPRLQHSTSQEAPVSGVRIKLQDLVQILSVKSACRDKKDERMSADLQNWLPVIRTVLSMLVPARPDLGEGRLPTVVQPGEFSLSTSVEEEA